MSIAQTALCQRPTATSQGLPASVRCVLDTADVSSDHGKKIRTDVNLIQISWEIGLEGRGRESCRADELGAACVAKETHHSILQPEFPQ